MDWIDSYMASIGRTFGEERVRKLQTRFVRREEAIRNLTIARMRRIAEASHHLTYAARGEGEVKADFTIPAADYHGWARKFADADGTPNYECWDDPEWIREYKRDNPQLVCKTAAGPQKHHALGGVKWRPKWLRTEGSTAA